MSTMTETPRVGDAGPGAFVRFTDAVARMTGSSFATLFAAAAMLVWLMSGPMFHFSDTWQLVVNTGTTVLTFLMVFVIQSTQSRDTRALHLKLDELIRVNQTARNSLFNLEEMSEAEIEEVKKTFDRIVSLPAETR